MKKKFKTIKAWLESIPDQTIRNQALKNCNYSAANSPCSSLSSAISRAFVWANSPEGHDYWSSFRKGLTPSSPKTTKP